MRCSIGVLLGNDPEKAMTADTNESAVAHDRLWFFEREAICGDCALLEQPAGLGATRGEPRLGRDQRDIDLSLTILAEGDRIGLSAFLRALTALKYALKFPLGRGSGSRVIQH